MTTQELAIESHWNWTDCSDAIPDALGSLAIPAFMAPEGDPYIAEQIRTYAARLTEAIGTEQSYGDVYDREVRFFDKVYDAVMEMSAGHNDKVRVYFDVDQTLTEGIGQHRVVRPAFSWAIAELHGILGDRLQVGLLTTLKNHNNTYDMVLADVKPDLVDPSYLLCTREYDFSPKQVSLLACEDNDAERLQSVAHLLDPALVTAAKQDLLEARHWHDPDGKLEILDDQLQLTEQENIRLVFVDNMASAAAIRRDHPRLRGVCVAREVQDEVFRTGFEAAHGCVEAARTTAAA